eukprot:11195089-Lingulodinium_polyedra.AAC.1
MSEEERGIMVSLFGKVGAGMEAKACADAFAQLDLGCDNLMVEFSRFTARTCGLFGGVLEDPPVK